jgi:hypothetical protein
MNRKARLLERTYLAILGMILLLIILTPYIIRSGFTVLEEELVEVAAIILLLGVGYAVLLLYRREAARNLKEANRLKRDKGDLKNQLSEAFSYIGTVNIQIQQIRSLFSDIKKFPENKKDFLHILQLVADRTLCMVSADWILFRIIDTRNLNTLREYTERRGNAAPMNCKISNRALASKEKFEVLTVVESEQENFHIRTFCIIPKKKISGDQKIFIKAAVNQLEMLFLIFTSIYYKESQGENGTASYDD